MSTRIKVGVYMTDETRVEIDTAGVVGWKTIENLSMICEEVINLIWQKEGTYGSAWREQGWMGNLARIMSKTSRLKNMVWQDNPLADAAEPVNDTVRDLIAICLFFLHNYEQRNRWGR